MDPQQELFIAIRNALIELEVDVYDAGLPPEGVPYPFVHLGGTTLIDDANKTAVFGNVTQTINVWMDDLHKRGTFSEIMLKIKKACRSISATPNFSWHVVNVDQTIMDDNTTDKTLLHGILSIEFKFC